MRVKVGDLGLAVQSDGPFVHRPGDKKPWYRFFQKKKKELNSFRKWTAPEVFENSRYSQWTDVWSYGILLWEVYTFGTEPFRMIESDPRFGGDVKQIVNHLLVRLFVVVTSFTF